MSPVLNSVLSINRVRVLWRQVRLFSNVSPSVESGFFSSPGFATFVQQDWKLEIEGDQIWSANCDQSVQWRATYDNHVKVCSVIGRAVITIVMADIWSCEGIYDQSICMPKFELTACAEMSRMKLLESSLDLHVHNCDRNLIVLLGALTVAFKIGKPKL